MHHKKNKTVTVVSRYGSQNILKKQQKRIKYMHLPADPPPHENTYWGKDSKQAKPEDFKSILFLLIRFTSKDNKNCLKQIPRLR